MPISERLEKKNKPWSDLTPLFIAGGTRPQIFNTNALGHVKSTCEPWLSPCCLHDKVTFWFSLPHQIHDFRSSFKHVCNITLTFQYLCVNTCQLLRVIFFLLERRSKKQCKYIRGKKVCSSNVACFWTRDASPSLNHTVEYSIHKYNEGTFKF